MPNPISSAVATMGAAASAVKVTQAPEVRHILDSALDLFAEVGVRRTTLGDVARRAGIDRVTIYRRIGSKDALIEAVVAREATAMFAEVSATARAGTTLEERVELGFTAMMELVRGNAMLAKMLVVEPQTVLEQLTTEGTLLVTGAAIATMGFFQEAVEDGLLDSTEGMEASAELLVRVVHSYLLTPRALIDLDSAESMRSFARDLLVPMVLRARDAR